MIFRGATIFGALMLMILGPAAALDEPRPAMFGWQMYSSVTYLPEIEVEKADGTWEERLLEDVASGLRPEVDYFGRVPQFLCARERDLVRVRLVREHPKLETEAECSQY